MKTKLTFLILIFFISLSSFTIFGNRDSNKRNSEFYEAKLVIKKESESTVSWKFSSKIMLMSKRIRA